LELAETKVASAVGWNATAVVALEELFIDRIDTRLDIWSLIETVRTD
jgi:hypothetical protein